MSNSDVLVETGASTPGSNILKKTFFVEIRGTMNGFSVMGPTAGTWKPTEGKGVDMFGSDLCGQTDSDMTVASEALRHATIRKATLLQCYNNFNVPLGVSCSCLPSHEVVECGDKYAFTTMPCSSTSTPYLLHEASDSQHEAAQWRRDYGRFTHSNLETEQVLKVPNCPFVFVHENHPVINLLRMNKHLVGVDVDTAERMDKEWVKVTQSLLSSSCDAIRKNVLGRIQTEDLNSLQVQLHRIGDVGWDHVSQEEALVTFAPHPSWTAAELQSNFETHQKLITEKPSVFMARIALEYEVNA